MRTSLVVLCLSVLPLVSSAQQPATWRVSEKPILQIGQVEGDPNYEFFKAVGSLRLADGRIVVLNAGTYQLRVYDAAGKIVSTRGKRGFGPGEFIQPVSLMMIAPDSLLVFDRGNNRYSVHTLSGDFARGYIVLERNADPKTVRALAGEFPFDEWIYNRSWVNGPPMARGRGPVRAAIDMLPAPDPAIGYRYVKVSPQGHLWVRGPVRKNAPIPWTVYDLDSKVLARVTTPAGFDVQDIGRDYVLGVSRDALEVEYIRLYRLDGASAAPIRRLLGPDSLKAPPARVASPATLNLMRATLRDLSSAQEVYYADAKNNYAYAPDVKLLGKWTTPKGLDLVIVQAAQTGWTGMITDLQSGVSCVLTQGSPEPVDPPGWTMGYVTCG